MSDFTDWKQHPVTKAVFAGLKEREQDVVETLVTQAGHNSIQDAFHSGYIAALRDVYRVEVEDLKEGTDV